MTLNNDLFVPIGEKRVFSAALGGGSAETKPKDRSAARGASVKQRSAMPLLILVATLLLGGGGLGVFLFAPELIPGMGGSEVENPFLRQVNLWRLQYPDVDGTSAEHLRKGRKYYLDDTLISYRLADDELRKALLLDPENLDAIAAFVENLARLPGIRQRTEDVKTAFEGIDYAIKRDGNNPELRRAHGALLLALDNIQKAQSALHMALRLDGQNAETLLLLAETDVERNNEQAIKQVEQARAIEPSLSRIELIAGRARAGQGEFKRALAHFTTRLKRDPGHAETLMQVARLYATVGSFKESVKTLEAIISTDDKNLDARLMLGKVYYQALGDLRRADLQLTMAAESLEGEEEFVERDLAVLTHLAHVRALRNKWADAEQYAQRVLQMDTTFLPAHYMMGRVLNNKAEYQSSLKFFDRILQAMQGRYLEAPSRMAAGDIKLALGQYKKAAREFERVVENFPSQTRAYLGMAAAYARLGDSANMAMAMRKVLDVEPNYSEDHWVFSDYPVYSSDLEPYLEALEEFQQREDDASIRLSSMGIVAYHMGEYGEADRFLKQALREDPKNLGALIYAGATALKRRSNSSALTIMKDAYLVNHLHLVTRHLLGQAQFANGKLADAEKTLTDVINDDSTFLPSLCTLGDLERKRKRLDKARDFYLNAYQISGDMMPAKRGLFLVGH